jgi:hypothetical protein
MLLEVDRNAVREQVLALFREVRSILHDAHINSTRPVECAAAASKSGRSKKISSCFTTLRKLSQEPNGVRSTDVVDVGGLIA